MNATSYEIRREATSGSPTNMYDVAACGGMCDTVMHWSNGCTMDWVDNQEITAIGNGSILRWRTWKIKMAQDRRHLNEQTDYCHKSVYKSRNVHIPQILIRWSRRHQHQHQLDVDVGIAAEPGDDRHVRLLAPSTSSPPRSPMEHLRFDHLFVYTATIIQLHHIC
jgi:hypothetical protein